MSTPHYGQHQTKLVTSRPRDNSEQSELNAVREETLNVLPGLLLTRPDIKCEGWFWQNVHFDEDRCPKLPPIKVKVVNMDTVDEAVWLSLHPPRSINDKPVAVLNLADEDTAGGGFMKGRWAQEESICYRTSLSLTLDQKKYPIPPKAVVYSPTVLVFRTSKAKGHKIVSCITDPQMLVKISVISGAAVKRPELAYDSKLKRETYQHDKDWHLMKEKMRVILRTAIRNGHRKIVLGAFGCGVFQNPKQEVAIMWKSVLREQEFRGGWWEDVVFAITGYMKPGDNLQVFHDELDGVELH